MVFGCNLVSSVRWRTRRSGRQEVECDREIAGEIDEGVVQLYLDIDEHREVSAGCRRPKVVPLSDP